MNDKIPWVEKYRPKKLTDYYISKTQLNVVKEWIKDLIETNEDAKQIGRAHV